MIPNLIMIWSLAVEEHFYLVFPFAVRFMKTRALVLLLASLVLAEPVLRWTATHYIHHYVSIYFWTVFRLDPLAMGALLALAVEHERSTAWLTRWSGALACVTGAIFGALSFLDPKRFDRDANSYFFNSVGYSLLAVASAAVLAYVLLHADTLLSRLLGNRAVVLVGLVSYGLYLYHQLVRMTLERLTGLGDHSIFPLSVGVAILFSWLSFRFMEQPVIAWGHRTASRM